MRALAAFIGPARALSVRFQGTSPRARPHWPSGRRKKTTASRRSRGRCRFATIAIVTSGPRHERGPYLTGHSSLGRTAPPPVDCAAHGPSASAGAGSVVAPPTPSIDPAFASDRPERPAFHLPRHGAPADPADGPSLRRDFAAEEAPGNGSPRSTRVIAAEPPRRATAGRSAVSLHVDPVAISTNQRRPAAPESPARASLPSLQQQASRASVLR